jgi:hypothetical protein
MSQTGTHVTDNDATPDAVIPDIACRFVLVRPKSADVTGGWDVYDPDAGKPAMRMDEGEQYIFDAGEGNKYAAGVACGYTKTVNAGPFTFQKKHSDSRPA